MSVERVLGKSLKTLEGILESLVGFSGAFESFKQVIDALGTAHLLRRSASVIIRGMSENTMIDAKTCGK